MHYFDHEKLDVYQVSIELVIIIEDVIKQFPKGRAYLIDQLQRASSSIPFAFLLGVVIFNFWLSHLLE